MSDAAEMRLAEALATAETLRVEIERLRDLLGLNSRGPDGHQRAWGPTLFTQTAASVTVDSASPLEDKLSLLRSLFGARSDVYAQRRESASTGKSGWSPAVHEAVGVAVAKLAHLFAPPAEAFGEPLVASRVNDLLASGVSLDRPPDVLNRTTFESLVSR